MKLLSLIVVGLIGTNVASPTESNSIERVIVIGLDGAGSFHQLINPPTVNTFLKSGAYCNQASNQYPTSSGQNWGSIITGITAKKHGINNENINDKPYPDTSSPTTFKSILTKYPGSLVASYVNWSPINKGLIEGSIADKVVQINDKDDQLTDKIVQFINEKNKQIKYLFIQLDDIDHAGHSSGWLSKPYWEQYLKTDTNVNKILKSITNNDLDSSSLVVITADHGGIFKSHGGSTISESTVLFGARGPSVKQQRIKNGKVSNMDVAALTLHSLGIEIPKSYDAKVPNIFQ